MYFKLAYFNHLCSNKCWDLSGVYLANSLLHSWTPRMWILQNVVLFSEEVNFSSQPFRLTGAGFAPTRVQLHFPYLNSRLKINNGSRVMAKKLSPSQFNSDILCDYLESFSHA